MKQGDWIQVSQSLTHPNTSKMQTADGAQCAPQSTIKNPESHRTGPNGIFRWPTFTGLIGLLLKLTLSMVVARGDFHGKLEEMV